MVISFARSSAQKIKNNEIEVIPPYQTKKTLKKLEKKRDLEFIMRMLSLHLALTEVIGKIPMVICWSKEDVRACSRG